jgi:hypothetical protein
MINITYIDIHLNIMLYLVFLNHEKSKIDGIKKDFILSQIVPE